LRPNHHFVVTFLQAQKSYFRVAASERAWRHTQNGVGARPKRSIETRRDAARPDA
jgi:hypothetical protein